MSSARYHHHVATNVWHSQGAGLRDEDRAGLAWFAVEANDDATGNATAERLRQAGATVTPINRAWIDDPVKREMVTSHIPIPRAGESDEMAGVVCFLASDDAAYITGQTIYVDGGLTLFADFREPWSSE